MRIPNVRTTMANEESPAVDTIRLAFSTDPMARWVWRESHLYLAAMPAFVRAFAGGAFENGTAFLTEDLVSAALWLPPGVHSDEEALMGLIERTVPESVRDDLFGVLEQMGAFHPTDPHWYLPLIGVDPAYQGRGYGSALLTRALLRCDQDHLPAYLESSNPRNVPLYERHGFAVIGTIQAGSSPPMYPMFRPAR